MTRYGIGLIPDKESSRAILDAYSRNNVSLVNALTPQNFLYLPLLQTFFKSETEPKKILKSIVNSIKSSPFKTKITQATSVHINQLKIHVNKEAWLSELQDATVNICYPLIDSSKIDDKKRYAGSTIQEVNNYFTFGYRYIGDSYNPFIRLYDKSKEFDLVTLNEALTDINITFKAIVFYKVSKHKTLERVIAKMKLPSTSQ